MTRVSIADFLTSLIAVPTNAIRTGIDVDGDSLANYAELQMVEPEFFDELFRETAENSKGDAYDEEWGRS
ncbi:MAG: hypothetical protein PVJ46_10160 [Methyloceanibacter sp.]|jgi:hypothetical protein